MEVDATTTDIHRSLVKSESATIQRLKDLRAELMERQQPAWSNEQAGMVDHNAAGLKSQLRCISCDQNIPRSKSPPGSARVQASDGRLYFAHEPQSHDNQLTIGRPQSAKMRGHQTSLAVARTSLGACNGSAPKLRTQRPQSAGVGRRNAGCRQFSALTEEEMLEYVSQEPSKSNLREHNLDEAPYERKFDFRATDNEIPSQATHPNKTQVAKHFSTS